MKKRVMAATMLGALVLLVHGSPRAQADDRTRVFDAPVDRVWTVARSTLKSLGWDIDEEDRGVGWMRTDSRRLEGEDYGVYAKGVKHRLRVVVKGQDGGRTSVTVERHAWREERILWMDRSEDIAISDHAVEQQILDAIGRIL